MAQAEAYEAGVIGQACAEGDIAEDVDPATVARFMTALVLGYHLMHVAGVADPDVDSWAALMARMAGALHAA